MASFASRAATKRSKRGRATASFSREASNTRRGRSKPLSCSTSSRRAEKTTCRKDEHHALGADRLLLARGRVHFDARTEGSSRRRSRTLAHELQPCRLALRVAASAPRHVGARQPPGRGAERWTVSKGATRIVSERLVEPRGEPQRKGASPWGRIICG